jgi:hypothetical protein
MSAFQFAAFSWGGFHKSWAHCVKRKAHPNLGENAQIRDTKLGKKDECKFQALGVNCIMKSTPGLRWYSC